MIILFSGKNFSMISILIFQLCAADKDCVHILNFYSGMHVFTISIEITKSVVRCSICTCRGGRGGGGGGGGARGRVLLRNHEGTFQI